jgi:hypothetical protein
MFGFAVFLLGLPTVLFFNNGVFDEYDYWAGTVSLVVFAFVEMILFSWVFGIKKGWAEITEGSDIKVPSMFKFIIKYVTPIMLGWVLWSSIPELRDTLSHKVSKEKIAFYNDEKSINEKIASNQLILETKKDYTPSLLEKSYSDEALTKNKKLNVSTFLLLNKQRELIKMIDNPSFRKSKIEAENKTMLFKNISRSFLLVLWLGIAYLVYLASVKRKKAGQL